MTVSSAYDTGYDKGLSEGMNVVIMAFKKVMDSIKDKPANIVVDLLNKFLEELLNGDNKELKKI